MVGSGLTSNEVFSKVIPEVLSVFLAFCAQMCHLRNYAQQIFNFFLLYVHTTFCFTGSYHPDSPGNMVSFSQKKRHFHFESTISNYILLSHFHKTLTKWLMILVINRRQIGSNCWKHPGVMYWFLEVEHYFRYYDVSMMFMIMMIQSKLFYNMVHYNMMFFVVWQW